MSSWGVSTFLKYIWCLWQLSPLHTLKGDNDFHLNSPHYTAICRERPEHFVQSLYNSWALKKEGNRNRTSKKAVHLGVHVFQAKDHSRHNNLQCSCLAAYVSLRLVIFLQKQKRCLILKKFCHRLLVGIWGVRPPASSLWAVLRSTVNQSTAGCQHLNAPESWHWMGTWIRASSFSLFSENRGQEKTGTGENVAPGERP